MKKMFLVMLVLVLAGTFAFAADTATATLLLKGTVESQVTLSLSDTTAAQNLLLDTTVGVVEIGTMTVFSNTEFTLSVDSANDFYLTNDTLDATNFNATYNLTFNGSTYTADGVMTSMDSIAGDYTLGLTILTTTGLDDSQVTDTTTFTDTLTFTIESL